MRCRRPGSAGMRSPGSGTSWPAPPGPRAGWRLNPPGSRVEECSPRGGGECRCGLRGARRLGGFRRHRRRWSGFRSTLPTRCRRGGDRVSASAVATIIFGSASVAGAAVTTAYATGWRASKQDRTLADLATSLRAHGVTLEVTLATLRQIVWFLRDESPERNPSGTPLCALCTNA